MKIIAYGKLNYIHVNYNGKTGFCYTNNTIGFSLLESHEKEKQKQKMKMRTIGNVKNVIISFLDLDN